MKRQHQQQELYYGEVTEAWASLTQVGCGGLFIPFGNLPSRKRPLPPLCRVRPGEGPCVSLGWKCLFLLQGTGLFIIILDVQQHRTHHSWPVRNASAMPAIKPLKAVGKRVTSSLAKHSGQWKKGIRNEKTNLHIFPSGNTSHRVCVYIENGQK